MTSLLTCYIFVLYLAIFSVPAKMEQAQLGNNAFANKIFQTLTTGKSQQNVVYSPASIQACMAMAFLGANGTTAEELRTGLILGNGEKLQVAQNYAQFLAKAFSAQDKAGPRLKLANRIYVNNNLQLKSDISDLSERYFKSRVEKLPFENSQLATKTINTWVEQETNGQIRNLIPEGSLAADTSAILVNAIYFKGKWLQPFSDVSTHRADFLQSSQKKSSVDMMYGEENFKYAEVPELDAKVLELPYENSDLSMLIILPNEVEGLSQLEQKLADFDMHAIAKKMAVEDVEVFLPKFKIEFEVDLKDSLSQLGISKIFSDSAELNGLFDSEQSQKVSDVFHKAFLDVDEAGTEAAAATFIKVVPMMLNLGSKVFRADHPFVFAIRNEHTVYYAGHVANI